VLRKDKIGVISPLFFLKWHKKNEKGRKSEEKNGKNERKWERMGAPKAWFESMQGQSGRNG